MTIRILLYLLNLILCCSACSRVVFSEATPRHILQPGQKIFVQLNAPYAHEDETLQLIPNINLMLRQAGHTVSSGVENRSTTPEWRARTAKRMQDFAPDFILQIDQLRDQTLGYTNPKTGGTKTYRKNYKLTLLKGDTQEVVTALEAHGSKRFLRSYTNMWAKGLRRELIGQ